MSLFQYRAVVPDGGTVQGRIDAPDRASAAAHIQARGHVLVALAPAPPEGGLWHALTRDLGGAGKHLGPGQVTGLVGRLALLLEAGFCCKLWGGVEDRGWDDGRV